jgi:primosomal protein N' (replication factor Y)
MAGTAGEGESPGTAWFDLIFDIPSPRTFCYRIDEKGEAAPGKRAMVPFGRRESLGYIIARREAPPGEIGEEGIKAIRRVVDKAPLFDGRDLDLASWMAGYYLCGLGQALAAMIPSGRRPGVPALLPGEVEEITGDPLELSEESGRP